MNYTYLILAIVLYGISCLVMFGAGRTPNKEGKALLFFFDMALTVAAWMTLYVGFTSPWLFLAFFAIWQVAMTMTFKVFKHLGYDPYGIHSLF
jgi:hypothetical protein